MVLSQALRDTYASVGPEIVLYTLELNHKTFPGPFYMVRNWEDFEANLENSGPLVTFQKFAFDFTEPKKDAVGNASLNIRIDNVSREMSELLENSIDGSQTPIEVVYRIYLASDPSGPQNTPLKLSMRNITTTNTSASGTAEIIPLINRRFPNVLYTNIFQNLFLG